MARKRRDRRGYDPRGDATVRDALKEQVAANTAKKEAVENARRDAANKKHELLIQRRAELKIKVVRYDAARKNLAVELESLEVRETILKSKIARRESNKATKMAKAQQPFAKAEQRTYISTLSESKELAQILSKIAFLKAPESETIRKERRELEAIKDEERQAHRYFRG